MSPKLDIGVRVFDEAYDAADLGRAVKRLRAARGLTQDALAQWLGVSRQTVISLEQGGPVSVSAAMRALGIMGAKVVIAPKDAIVGETDPG